MAPSTRQRTPDIMSGDVLGEIFAPPAPVVLRWDYTQAGEHAALVQGYAQSIKRSETRATQEIVTAGESLLAAKELLPHGKWEDWLQVEFGLTDRTAQRIMRVAAVFGGKSDTVSLLSTSVLYLLAAPSTPAAARDAVIDVAATKPVTKAAAQAIINEHKPQPAAPPAAPAAVIDVAATKPAPPPASTWQRVTSGIPADLAALGAVEWSAGQGWRVVAADGAIRADGLTNLAACLAVLRSLRPAPVVAVPDGGPLPAWVTDDEPVRPAPGVGWTVVIDQDADPQAVGRLLARVVATDWMEALWNAYMRGTP